MCVETLKMFLESVFREIIRKAENVDLGWNDA